RLFFVIFAPDSQQESSPLSGRKSTQATVRICGASSDRARRAGTAPSSRRTRRAARAFPAHLPRIEQVIEPEN
ncbi:hypothetical protein, partial [Bradyrhizobium sp. Mp27]|uniref:hypothetical protein n=1 Tax=Bradyrhizobium sp. Mp27 TaxID=3042157 RepID=UPI00248B6A5C